MKAWAVVVAALGCKDKLYVGDPAWGGHSTRLLVFDHKEEADNAAKILGITQGGYFCVKQVEIKDVEKTREELLEYVKDQIEISRKEFDVKTKRMLREIMEDEE